MASRRTTELTQAAVVCTAVERLAPQLAADERQTRVRLERDHQLLRSLCTERGGTVLQVLDSGLLLAFASVEQAVLYAIASQQALAGAAAQRAASDNLDHRIGIHAGSIEATPAAPIGAGAVLAASLPALAAPGGICLSQAVYTAVKHRLALTVTDLGLQTFPGGAEPIGVYAIAPPSPKAAIANVFIAYRPVEPEGSLAHQFYRALTAAGYHTFMAGEELPHSRDWVQQLEQELQGCDYLLLLLSEQSVRSEMVAEKLRRAQELSEQHPTGKPKVLPIRAGLAADVPLGEPLQGYLERSPQCFWQAPAETPHLIADVLARLASGLTVPPAAATAIAVSATAAASGTTRPLPAAIPELPEGQVAVNSAFYLERPPIETRARETILQPGALIRIKAPRQMGKTSLLAHILHYACQQGCDRLSLSFQIADRAAFSNLDRFLQWFCASTSRRLHLPVRLRDFWDEIFGSKDNCTAYFEEHILANLERPLVLGLDEVDCIFQYPNCAADFLGLLRAWHEEAKNRAIWKKLRLVIVHSTEVYVPMGVNQSPFNVGLPLELPEFNAAQMRELAQRHGLPWQAEVAQLMALVGGHPYLARLAMYAIARQDLTLPDLLATAPTEAGLYGDHLRRHFWQLRQQPRLAAAMRAVVHNPEPIALATDEAFRLHSTGLVSYQGNRVQPRCELYRRYFRDRAL